jgi:hypothetical protein
MARINVAADAVVESIAAEVRRRMQADAAPALTAVARAVADLESALGGGAPRRGRPRGRRRGPGRPPKSQAAARTPRRAASSGDRAPRGALKELVRRILTSADKPMKLAAIRNQTLKSPHFRGRDEMTLYRQIVRDISLMPDVKKVSGGMYAIE